MNVTEELLDLQSLKSQARGIDLFSAVSTTVNDMKILWNKMSGIITDGAPSMTGERSGLATFISNKVSKEWGKAVKLHCIIHQQVLCAKYLQYDHIIKPVVKAINICSRPLCHHQFQQFLNEIDAEYGDVVYYTDVRWLSRGSALMCFYSLRQQIGEFLAEKKQPMQELSDPLWLADLGFLVNITKHLTVLNTSLQGPEAVISQLYLQTKAFEAKLQLFKGHLLEAIPNTAHFSALQEIMTRFPQSNFSAQTRRYTLDISSLAEEFKARFQDFAAIKKEITLFSSPFSVDTDDVPNHLQLELIELQCDTESRNWHQQLSLANFYRQLDKDRFREIRDIFA